jgi:hypothetical protein
MRFDDDEIAERTNAIILIGLPFYDIRSFEVNLL